MPEQDVLVSQQELIFIFFVVIFFLALLVTFFFVIIINYYRTNARRQSDLLKAIVETQEKERNRIAIDMHDELGPLLSAVKLQVGSIRDSESSRMNATLMDTQDLLDEAISQIRQIIRDLVPRNIDQKGLTGSLEDMKHYFETFTPIKVNLSLDGFKERFSLQSEINIYRIIQEVVNNAVKHAGAALVNVSLKTNEHQLKIEVSDTGKGFNTDTTSEGSGRKNIETRIRLNKGEYELKSSPGAGTAYFISFEKKNLLR